MLYIFLFAIGQGFNESEIEAIRLAESEYISAFTGDFDGNSGRVELRINGTWGTVCDHNWNYFDARVACRSVYYVVTTWANNQHGL